MTAVRFGREFMKRLFGMLLVSTCRLIAIIQRSRSTPALSFLRLCIEFTNGHHPFSLAGLSRPRRFVRQLHNSSHLPRIRRYEN